MIRVLIACYVFACLKIQLKIENSYILKGSYILNILIG